MSQERFKIICISRSHPRVGGTTQGSLTSQKLNFTSFNLENLTRIRQICNYEVLMGKTVRLVTFFIFTPILLLVSLIYLSYLSYGSSPNRYSFGQIPQTVAFAAIPSEESIINDQIITLDIRVENLRLFFNRHNSPLEPYAQFFVDISEKYELDFRLLPAIAMQESNLCKKAPKDSYNCWGFGIYGKKVTRFSNYEEAIETVARTLFNEYKSKGLITPEEIMSKYTPSNTGSWASSVNLFMNQLQ